MKRKRGPAEMVFSVLEALKDGPIVRERIMRAVGLNFYNLRDILEGLYAGGFLSYAVKGERRLYFMTPEGRVFHGALRSCLSVAEVCLK